MILRPPRSTLFPYTTLFRSADDDAATMAELLGSLGALWTITGNHARIFAVADAAATLLSWWTDRKSTRLNSSHSSISYAVFCLKKKILSFSKNLWCQWLSD